MIIRSTVDFFIKASVGLAITLAMFGPLALQGQHVATPAFEIEPFWPKPLADKWVTGVLGGVCVDAKDHVFVFNRRNLTDNELLAGHQAPPVIEFDPQGNVLNSWGDPEVVVKGPHGCAFDREGNVWITGNADGIVQKFTHDGSKLLLQIGTRGVFDTSDGSINGRALNSGHTQFFRPAGIAVDPANGDVFVADGYGNSRVVVFDQNGRFLRQWGRQGTKAEADAGEAGTFMEVVHCLSIGNDGLVYVCDRQGDRIQVFDKSGKFQKNIWIKTGSPHMPDESGTALWIGFSPDAAQKFMYVANEHNEEITILDHESGKILGGFGRVGHQLAEFTHVHSLAVDSKGNIYVAEVNVGERIQKFRIATDK